MAVALVSFSSNLMPSPSFNKASLVISKAEAEAVALDFDFNNIVTLYEKIIIQDRIRMVRSSQLPERQKLRYN